MSTNVLTVSADPAAAEPDLNLDLDLDVSIIDAAPVVPGLMRATDDGCGNTCASACTSCK
jgi:FxLD family lantipeptide